MSQKLLEVGDVLFGILYGDRLARRIVVERVTAKQAYTFCRSFKRNFKDGDWEIGATKYNRLSFYLSTPELENEYAERKLRQHLDDKAKSFHKIPIDQVRAILAILKSE